MTENDDIARIVGLCGLAFFVLASYAIARPASESLFLATYGSQALPYVWLTVGAVAVVVVSIHNRYVQHVSLVRLFAVYCGLSCVVLTCLVVMLKMEMADAVFALYVWKDVYIVVLIEVFWSLANTSFKVGTARWIYGLFCVSGSLGGIVANFSMGPLAKQIGTTNSLWLVIPVLCIAAVFCFGVRPRQPSPAEALESGPAPSFSEGFRVLARSRYLMLMLALIAVVQVVITLVDYQFNMIVESTYTDTDERTGVIARVYGYIDTGAIVLQLATGPVLRWLGIPITLLLIPLFLGAAVVSFAASPRFVTMAVTKVASKCFDYSLFRAAKEILYIPLNYAEKTQGKAVIDMLAYRVAKAAVSVLLIALVAMKAGSWVARHKKHQNPHVYDLSLTSFTSLMYDVTFSHLSNDFPVFL